MPTKQPVMLSKKKMQEENRRYQAERLVADAFISSPEAKKRIKAVIKEIKKAEKVAKRG